MVAFSFSVLSRLRTRTQSIYARFKHSATGRLQLNSVSKFESQRSSGGGGGSSVFSVAALSASSLAFLLQSNLSLCDGLPDDSGRSIRVGGKGSTSYVVKGSHKDLPQGFVDELRSICQDNLSLDYEEREFHGKPQNSFHRALNIPDVVVFPRSETEVSEIVKSCNKHKIPIVPYGGATSIEGHTLSPNGGVCIDMSSMKG